MPSGGEGTRQEQCGDSAPVEDSKNSKRCETPFKNLLKGDSGMGDGGGAPVDHSGNESIAKPLWQAWACCCGYAFDDKKEETSFCPSVESKLAKECKFDQLMRPKWEMWHDPSLPPSSPGSMNPFSVKAASTESGCAAEVEKVESKDPSESGSETHEPQKPTEDPSETHEPEKQHDDNKKAE